MRSLLLYTLLYTIVMELMLVAAVLYWPDFEQNVDALRLLAPIKSVKDIVQEIEQEGVIPYITSQQFFKGGNTLGTAAAVLFAVGAVAGEAHRGTLELLLARPYSRLRILSERWLFGAVCCCLPVFLTSATIPWMGSWIDEDFDIVPLMLCSVHESLFLLAVYGAAFFCSTIGSNPTRIALVLLFVSTFQFAIYFIEVVTKWSLYRLADLKDFTKIYEDYALDWTVCGPLVAAIVLSFTASYLAFRRRLP